MSSATRIRAVLLMVPPVSEQRRSRPIELDRLAPVIVARFGAGTDGPCRGPGCAARAPLRWHAAAHRSLHPPGDPMNRRELIAALAERIDTDKRSADAALQAVHRPDHRDRREGRGRRDQRLRQVRPSRRAGQAAPHGPEPGDGRRDVAQIKASSARVKITPLKAFKDAVLTGKRARQEGTGEEDRARRRPRRRRHRPRRRPRRRPRQEGTAAKKTIAKKTTATKTTATKTTAKRTTAKKTAAKHEPVAPESVLADTTSAVRSGPCGTPTTSSSTTTSG